MNEQILYVSLDDMDTLKETVSKNKNSKIIVKMEPSDTDTFGLAASETVIFDHIDYFKSLKLQKANLFFQYDSNIFSLEKVLEDEAFLNQIVEEIRSYQLSPLEQHVAIYSIVINFKPYAEEKDNESPYLSRGFYEYMNNNFFCCAGASNLMTNLHHRLQLPCTFTLHNDHMYSLEFQKSHASNFVFIDDPKYQINGYFYSDATSYIERGDGLVSENYFRTMLMDSNELQQHLSLHKRNYDAVTIISLLDDIEGLEEMHASLSDWNDFLVSLKAFDLGLYELVKQIDFTGSNQDLKDYLNQKYQVSPHKNLALLKATSTVKSKIYKNMTVEDSWNLEVSYFKNSTLLKNDLMCESYVLRDSFKEKIVDIQEKFGLSPSQITNFCTQCIWSDVPDFSFFGSHNETSVIWMRSFPKSILDNKEALEEQGFVFKYSEASFTLLRIEFPMISTEAINEMTLEEFFEFQKSKKDVFMNYYSPDHSFRHVA